jgi:hypothetical protein
MPVLNGKMSTIVVMYTLKRSDDRLLEGPIKKVYASYAPKRHAVAVARREADKRGFKDQSCIEVNNDWDAYVHDKTSRQAQLFNENFFLKSTEAMKLPTYGLN